MALRQFARGAQSAQAIPPSEGELAEVVASLYALARSDDWTRREDAGFSLRNLIERHFEAGMSLTRAWPTDPSNFVRRAACLACMQRKARTDAARVKAVLQRLAILMADDDPYVRKCCGPFVVGYLGYTYPALTLPWLEAQAESDDLNVRANVAKAFSQALGKQQPQAGLALLDKLADDPRHRVRSAVGASLRHIVRHLGEEAAVRLRHHPALDHLAHHLHGATQ